MKTVRPIIASNEVPFLQMRSVGSHSASGREKEGNKERIGLDQEKAISISPYNVSKIFRILSFPFSDRYIFISYPNMFTVVYNMPMHV